MAKKKITKKKVTPPKTKTTKSKSKAKSTSKPKTKTKKYVGKKRGRKPSVSNRYNTIKTAISLNYFATVNRKIKRYELKIVYDWIKNTYGTQSLRYVVMNIDLIIDNFWQVYCNLYPVDLYNHARFFDWFYFKNYLKDEQKYHYQTDIIQVDLSVIGEGIFEFLYEDYPTESDKYYEICKSQGIKRESPPPSLYLEAAYCDIAKKGNVFRYKLLLDEDVPTSQPKQDMPVSQPPSVPVTKSVPSSAQTVVPDESLKSTPQTPQDFEIEVKKEQIKQEFLLREKKLKELSNLLKEKIITFEEYMKAVKEL